MTSPNVEWLYGLQRLGVKLGLSGIRGLLTLLGRPEAAYPSILVAGTNGKGSVSAMLDAMLLAHGVRSGLYTSPHLVRPNERIRISGRDVDDEVLSRLLGRLKTACERGVADGELGVHPSFFEVMTAAALEAFREASVDVAVLEVGLGGRLDATNAVEPVVSVVVTVAMDHVAQLGPTLEHVATEKAWIARPGRPLVTGVDQPGPLAKIRERCREVGADLVEAREVATVVRKEGGRFDVTTDRGAYAGLAPSLPGEHQFDNTRTAIVAFERLAEAIGLAVRPDAVRQGLGVVRWPARLQWIPGEPDTLVDGAHNGAGAQALALYLDSLDRPKPVLLTGTMRDKDHVSILEPIASRCAAVVLTKPPVERAADPASLVELTGRFAPRVDAREDPAEALTLARSIASDSGTFVLVAGSLYLAGAVLRKLGDPGPVSM